MTPLNYWIFPFLLSLWPSASSSKFLPQVGFCSREPPGLRCIYRRLMKVLEEGSSSEWFLAVAPAWWPFVCDLISSTFSPPRSHPRLAGSLVRAVSSLTRPGSSAGLFIRLQKSCLLIFSSGLALATVTFGGGHPGSLLLFFLSVLGISFLVT